MRTLKIANKTLIVFTVVFIMSLTFLSCGDGGATDEEPASEDVSKELPVNEPNSISTWYRDTDGDGYSDNTSQESEKQPDQYFSASDLNATSGDCDDSDNQIYPGAVELADDGVDQNCNGVDLRTWHKDMDGDGYANDMSKLSEIQPDGYYLSEDLNAISGDCNDNDNGIYPRAIEILDDGIDQNCNGLDLRTWYKDYDADRHSDGTTQESEATLSKYNLIENLIAPSGDCDDSNNQIYPGAVELADDGVDQNCNGLDLKTWYIDLDGDQYAGNESLLSDNRPGTDFYLLSELIDIFSDCNDNNPDIYPGGVEKPFDGIDGNCDGLDFDCLKDVNIYNGDFNSEFDDITSLTGYTEITGNVILKWSSLNNFKQLYCLNSIHGDLVIVYNNELRTLEGLDNLKSIGGSLTISSNVMLRDLKNLNGLSAIGETLSIAGNDILTNLEGLNNLNSVDGSIWIYDSNALTNLEGLNRLTTIGGDLVIGLHISDTGGNNSLLNLQGLDSLVTIEGGLKVSNNRTIKTLNGINNLKTVGAILLIYNNKYLTSLEGLDNLISIEGGLKIINNARLKNLDGLKNITYIRDDLRHCDLIIEGNDALISLEALNNVKQFKIDDLILNNNYRLPDLVGLNNIHSIGGNLSVNNNLSLTSLKILNNIFVSAQTTPSSTDTPDMPY